MFRTHVFRWNVLLLAGLSLVAARGNAAARAAPDPNPGAMTVTGSFDVLNQYMFRGIVDDDVHLLYQQSFNGGEASQVIGSVGIGFSY